MNDKKKVFFHIANTQNSNYFHKLNLMNIKIEKHQIIQKGLSLCTSWNNTDENYLINKS
jgi:hypothetical protein